jgi:hypothetical protein
MRPANQGSNGTLFCAAGTQRRLQDLRGSKHGGILSIRCTRGETRTALGKEGAKTVQRKGNGQVRRWFNALSIRARVRTRFHWYEDNYILYRCRAGDRKPCDNVPRDGAIDSNHLKSKKREALNTAPNPNPVPQPIPPRPAPPVPPSEPLPPNPEPPPGGR